MTHNEDGTQVWNSGRRSIRAWSAGCSGPKAPGENLGEFRGGEDDAYFEALQKFVNIVHEQYVGGPFPFDDLTKNDVEVFMAAFIAGAA